MRWQAEKLLSELPFALATGAIFAAKKMTGGQITRNNLHLLPKWFVLTRFNNESFDVFHAEIMRWLGDL